MDADIIMNYIAWCVAVLVTAIYIIETHPASVVEWSVAVPLVFLATFVVTILGKLIG